jgi:general secretion pathway protein L
MSASAREKLIVHSGGERWRWLLVDRSGRVLRRGECDPTRPDWPVDRSITVLVDSDRCVGLTLDLPELPSSRLDQALRWAAEEHLASSAEDEHVVAGPRGDDGLCCVVIARETMRELRDRLGGAPVEVMVPDALCLPWQRDEAVFAALDGRLVARWGFWDFGAFEPDLVADMLPPAAPNGARWRGFGQGVPEDLAGRSVEVDPSDPLEAMVPAALDAPVNLLAGEWAPRSATRVRQQWRWAAGLAAAVAVLVLAGAAIELRLLKSEAEDLQAAIDAQFREAFPDVQRVVRHRAQAERELARLRFGESAGLLDLINRAAPIVEAQDAVRLQGLSYREGHLELALSAPDVAALDQFEQRLRAVDLEASVQSASLDGDRASGRVRIGERGQ